MKLQIKVLLSLVVPRLMVMSISAITALGQLKKNWLRTRYALLDSRAFFAILISA